MAAMPPACAAFPEATLPRHCCKILKIGQIKGAFVSVDKNNQEQGIPLWQPL
jgi:hypothetical protein